MSNLNVLVRVPECEEMVLTVIWDCEEPLALADVMELVNKKYSKTWKPQTVSTFLTRLREKGYLDMYRKGRYCYYVPLVRKDAYLEREITRLEYAFGEDTFKRQIEIK